MASPSVAEEADDSLVLPVSYNDHRLLRTSRSEAVRYFGRGLPFNSLTRCSISSPGLNVTTCFAGTDTLFPVRGLRAFLVQQGLDDAVEHHLHGFQRHKLGDLKLLAIFVAISFLVMDGSFYFGRDGSGGTVLSSPGSKFTLVVT